MKPACWSNSSKKFPSRGSSLPKNMHIPPFAEEFTVRLVAGASAASGPGAQPSQSAAAGARPGRLRRACGERKDVSAPVDRNDMPVLAVQGLACRRGERELFRPVDLDVRAGQIVWVRGA